MINEKSLKLLQFSNTSIVTKQPALPISLPIKYSTWVKAGSYNHKSPGVKLQTLVLITALYMFIPNIMVCVIFFKRSFYGGEDKIILKMCVLCFEGLMAVVTENCAAFLFCLTRLRIQCYKHKTFLNYEYFNYVFQFYKNCMTCVCCVPISSSSSLKSDNICMKHFTYIPLAANK